MDKRGKNIIYLSQCLLNQNLRFPGIAVECGAISRLLIPLINSGIGIESLPCLERLGWGGVERKVFYKYLPMVSKNISTKMFPIIKLLIRIWLRNFRKLCRKEAKKIVHQMLDYHISGYSILGIITTNDSPTCGYTKTINLLELSSKYKELGLKNEFFENPSLGKMKDFIPSLCEDGMGLFTAELIKEITKRKLTIKILGFDIWNDSIEDIKNILKELELTA